MISIRYNELLKILRECRKKSGAKGALPQYQVAKLSKIHAKILSKLANQPDAEVTLTTLEKLVSFFFDQFSKSPPPQIKDRKQLLDWVILNLIEIFPDSIVKPNSSLERDIIIRTRKRATILLRDELVLKLIEKAAK